MLKKLLVSIIIIIGLNSSQLMAQRIMGEAILGLNMSKVEGDLVNNGSFKYQKAGLNIGVGAIVPISDMFSFNIQALFSQKGAYKKYGINSDSAKPYYNTKLDYAEVPFLFSYHDKKGLIISTGVSYSRLVRVNWIINGRTISSSINDEFYNLDNWDYIADFKYKVYRNAYINLRYQYSITSIWGGDEEFLKTTILDKTQSADQRHSLISIRLTWVFGERQSKEVREGIE